MIVAGRTPVAREALRSQALMRRQSCVLALAMASQRRWRALVHSDPAAAERGYAFVGGKPTHVLAAVQPCPEAP